MGKHFIFILLLFNMQIVIAQTFPQLYAEPYNPATPTPGQDWKSQYDIVKNIYEKWQKENPNKDILFESRRMYDDVAPCAHCPAPLALASNILPILKAMPNISSNPIVGDLELQYIIEKVNTDHGINCHKFFESVDEQIHSKKYDGQFKQVAEGVFEKFSSVVQITYRAPNLDEIIYYYKDKNNHFIQVIVDKNGKALYRYFEYTPSAYEQNPYHLPDLSAPDRPLSNAETYPMFPPEKTPVQTNEKSGQDKPGFISAKGNAQYNGKFEYASHVAEQLHIPKNFDIGKADGVVTVGDLHFLGGIHSTVKGHDVEVGILAPSGVKIATITGEASLIGKNPKESITIPYSLNIDPIGMGIDGHISTGVGPDGRHQAFEMRFLEPTSSSDSERKEYVTMSASQDEGHSIIYDLKKNYVSDNGSIYTTAAGRDSHGTFIGVSYAPAHNREDELITLKAQTTSGSTGVYITYTRALR